MTSGCVAALFLGGEYGDLGYYRDLATTADLVLAADGGAKVLLDMGVMPAAVVGDFDSLDADAVRRLQEDGVELVRHPVRKDRTDGELVVEEALRRGAGELVLAGGTGALDHTLGHLAILRRLVARGLAARLVAPRLSVRVLKAPAEVVLSAGAGTRVSLVPLDDATRVTLEGLDYPLTRGLLPVDACLGLGNHVRDPGAATIRVHAGLVAVLVEDGDEPFAQGAWGTRRGEPSASTGTVS